MSMTSQPAKNRFCHALLIFAATIATLTVGCGGHDGPALGKVEGVITLDGQPAAGVNVAFSKAGARSSFGFTNDQGEYQLKYVKDDEGAVIGDHQVRIDFTQQEGATHRRIPEKYNRNTELTAHVERGSNVINFDLETQ